MKPQRLLQILYLSITMSSALNYDPYSDDFKVINLNDESLFVFSAYYDPRNDSVTWVTIQAVAVRDFETRAEDVK